MKAGRIRGFIALLSGLWLAASAMEAASAMSTGCASNPEIRRTIEAELKMHGLDPDGLLRLDSLRCSAPVSSSKAFVVTRVRRDPMLNAIDLTLNCVPKEACLPFLVSLLDEKAGHVSAEEHSPKLEHGPSLFLMNGHRQQISPGAKPARQTVVIPGQRLTLIWEKAHLRLTRKVICLDRGRPGEEIRIRPIGPGQVVRARVLDAEYVRAIS